MPDYYTILSIEINRLTKLYYGLNEEFIRNFIIQHPYAGKEEKRYFLLSNGVIFVDERDPASKIYNAFMVNSRNKYQLIQIIKNNHGES